MQMQMHHGPQGPARAPVPPPQSFSASRQTLLQQTEAVWIQLGKDLEQGVAWRKDSELTRSLGNLAEQMGNLDDAMASYERALRTNPNSIPAMSAMSQVLRTREDFPKAAEYLNAILKLDNSNGEAWGYLGTHRFRSSHRTNIMLTLLHRTLLPYDG
jgi:glucose repression mediator protein